MLLCNIIIRKFDNSSEIIGVCVDLKSKNLLIEENKNKRWIREGIGVSFKDWVDKDKSRYEILGDIPFYGKLESNKCSIIKDLYFKPRPSFDTYIDSEKIIGIYMIEKDLDILKFEYNKYRWKKYLYHKTGNRFEFYNEAQIWYSKNKNDKILNYEDFINENPLYLNTICDIPII
jgi:hypothetical protein